MEKLVTILQTVEAAIARSIAELNAVKAILAAEPPQEGGLNPMTEIRKHYAEVIDAMLHASGALGGEDSKLKTLKLGLANHGFQIHEPNQHQ